MFLKAFTGVQTLWSEFRTRTSEETGATAVEYALMVALIAAVIIIAVAFLGTSASEQFQRVGDSIAGA